MGEPLATPVPFTTVEPVKVGAVLVIVFAPEAKVIGEPVACPPGPFTIVFPVVTGLDVFRYPVVAIEKLLPGSSVDIVVIVNEPVEPVVVMVLLPGFKVSGEPVTVQAPLVAIPEVLGLRTTVKVPKEFTVTVLAPYVTRVKGDADNAPVLFVTKFPAVNPVAFTVIVKVPTELVVVMVLLPGFNVNGEPVTWQEAPLVAMAVFPGLRKSVKVPGDPVVVIVFAPLTNVIGEPVAVPVPFVSVSPT
jgi:hypothetical protein